MYFATLTGILIILCLKRACKRDGSYFLLAGLDWVFLKRTLSVRLSGSIRPWLMGACLSLARII
jgi:hypothetical protein